MPHRTAPHRTRLVEPGHAQLAHPKRAVLKSQVHDRVPKLVHLHTQGGPAHSEREGQLWISKMHNFDTRDGVAPTGQSPPAVQSPALPDQPIRQCPHRHPASTRRRPVRSRQCRQPGTRQSHRCTRCPQLAPHAACGPHTAAAHAAAHTAVHAAAHAATHAATHANTCSTGGGSHQY